MSDSNPDKSTPDSEQERLAKIAASLPGEVVSREAAFPKKRQRPMARLPETVRNKIETEATEEAAKDKASDGPKAPVEKPKFKVTRSPFAPRIDQAAKSTSPMGDSWGDEESETPKSEPVVAKKAEPEVANKAEPAKPELKPIPRPTPTKLEVTRAPVIPEAKEAPKPTPETKPVAKEEAPKVIPTPVTATPPAQKLPEPVKPAAKTTEPAVKLPTPVKQSAPTKLPSTIQPAAQTAKPLDPAAQTATPKPTPLPTAAKPVGTAPRTAPRPKAAPTPSRQVIEEEPEGVSIIWVAFDALAAVASIAFAALIFMNMAG